MISVTICKSRINNLHVRDSLATRWVAECKQTHRLALIFWSIYCVRVHKFCSSYEIRIQAKLCCTNSGGLVQERSLSKSKLANVTVLSLLLQVCQFISNLLTQYWLPKRRVIIRTVQKFCRMSQVLTKLFCKNKCEN